MYRSQSSKLNTTILLRELTQVLYSASGFKIFIAIFCSAASEFLVFLLSVIPIQMLVATVSGRSPFFSKLDLEGFVEFGPKDSAVVVFAVILIFFFLVKFAIDRWLTSFVRRESNVLLDSNGGWVKFDDQDSFSKGFLRNYLNVTSSLLFITVSVAIIGFIFPALSALLVLLFLGAWLFRSREPLPTSHNDLGSDSKPSVGASYLLFLFVISFIVIFVHLGISPNFFVILISVILVRQSLARYARFVFGSKRLFLSRGKLSILLRPGRLQHSCSADKSHEILYFYGDRSLLKEALPQEFAELADKGDLSWYQSNIKKLLLVKLRSRSKNLVVVIKVYHKTIATKALHESKIFENRVLQRAPVEFLQLKSVNGFICLSYRLCPGCNFTKVSSGDKASEYRRQLMLEEVPKSFAQEYSQQHTSISERFAKLEFGPLFHLAAGKDKENLNELTLHLVRVCKILGKLPLTLFQRRFNQQFLLTDSSNGIFFLHWPDWSLEAVGAGVFKQGVDFEELLKFFDVWFAKVSEVHSISFFDFCVSALAFELETSLIESRYFDALKCVEHLVRVFELDSEFFIESHLGTGKVEKEI